MANLGAPCFSSNPPIEGTPLSAEDREENGRLGNNSWCTCTYCLPMPTAEESLCCSEVNNILYHVEDGMCCITEHPNFRDICLDEQRVFFYFCMLGTAMRTPPLPQYRRSLRKTAYRAFICWVHDSLGPRKRRPIPSCAVRTIREQFPDPAL